MRNREHAKATRERRKLYTKIIEIKMSQLDSRVLKFLEKKPDYLHLKELQVKREKVKDFFKTMVILNYFFVNNPILNEQHLYFTLKDSSETPSKSKWLKFGLEGILCKSDIRNFGEVVHSESCGWEEPKKLLMLLLEELRMPMNFPGDETEPQL
jgi:hypothetical protein